MTLPDISPEGVERLSARLETYRHRDASQAASTLKALVGQNQRLRVALKPVLALVAALDGKYGFPDDTPVDTRHMGDGKYNDFPGLTYGDLRAIAQSLTPGDPS